MEIDIIKNEKSDVEMRIDNVTVAEILRVYLNKQGIELVAWRREHPSKPALMKIKSNKTVKKEVSDAVSQIKKDLAKITSVIKK